MKILVTRTDPIVTFTSTKQKIDSFAALPIGWHYGEGRTPLRSTIDNAHDWHLRLMRSGLISPSAPGKISVVEKYLPHHANCVLNQRRDVPRRVA